MSFHPFFIPKSRRAKFTLELFGCASDNSMNSFQVEFQILCTCVFSITNCTIIKSTTSCSVIASMFHQIIFRDITFETFTTNEHSSFRNGSNTKAFLLFIITDRWIDCIWINCWKERYRWRQYYGSKVLHNTEVAWFLTIHRSLNTVTFDKKTFKEYYSTVNNASFGTFGAKISRNQGSPRNLFLGHFASKLTKITILWETKTLNMGWIIDQFMFLGCQMKRYERG